MIRRSRCCCFTLAALSVGAVILALASCAQILGIDSSRHLATADGATDGRADGRHDAVDAPTGDGAHPVQDANPWWCLQRTPAQLDPGASVTTTVVTFNALDPVTSPSQIDGGSDMGLGTYTGVRGLAVTPCSLLDPFCKAPFAPAAVTNDAGFATFSIGETDSVFFETVGSGWVPVHCYPGPFIAGETKLDVSISEFTPQGLQLLAAALGITIDLDAGSGAGMLFVATLDCFDHHIAGVTYTLDSVDAGAAFHYMRGGLPSLTATSTDSLGIGFALNVPAGGHTVAATLVDGGAPVGQVTLSLPAGVAIFADIRSLAQH